MAEFNRFQQQAPLPPSYVQGSMRQYEGDRSAAILGEGLTKAFSDFIKATDENIQRNIADDVARGFDQLNQEGGVDRLPEANLPDQPMEILPSRQAADMPAGIQQAQRSAQTLQSAHQRGVIPEHYYWDRMNSLLRQTRGKYPGYRHEVDQAFRSVTGSRGNELRDYLWRNAGKEDPAVRERNNLVDWAVKNGTLPEDFFDREGTPQAYGMSELQQSIYTRTKEDADVRRLSAKFDLDAKEGKMTAEQAENLFRMDAHRTVNKILNSTVTRTGNTWRQLRQQVEEWEAMRAKGQDLNPDQKGQIRGLINQFKTLATEALQSEYTRSRASDGDPRSTYSTYLGEDKRKDVFAAAMAPIANLERAILTGDTALMKTTLDWLESTKEMDTRDVLQRVPQLREARALSEAVGAETAGFIIRAIPGVEKELIRGMIQHNLSRASRQTGPVTDPTQGPSLAEDISEAERNPEAKGYGNAAVRTWSNLAQEISRGSISGQIAANQVQYVFGPKNYEVMAGMNADSRRNFFNQVASPHVTEAIKKLKDQGDQRSWDMYKTWTLRSFQALARGHVNELAGYMMDRSRMAVVFDPKINQYVITGMDLDRQGDPMSGTQASADFQQVQREVNFLNALVRNVVPIMAAEGVNPADQMARMLHSMGVRSDIPRSVADGLAEGAADAAGPPSPKDQDIWKGVEPFRPQFRAPVGTRGDNKPGEIDTGFAPVLDLIGKAEGTDKARGYNETLAYGAYTGGNVDLTSMTLDEIDFLQTKMLRHPRNSWNSSALGRYQIVRSTLRELRREMGLKGHEVFTPALQDKMAIRLMRRRGLDKWMRNEIDDATFMAALSKEWASLPQASGQGTYAGQRTGAKVAEVMTTLARLKEQKTVPVMSRRAENVLNRIKNGELVKDEEFNKLPDQDKARILADAIGEM